MHLDNLVRLATDRVRHLDPGLGSGHHRRGGGEGRHQPGAALQHHRDRLVVQVDAVLDGADPGPHRGFDPIRGLGVGHDGPSGGAGLGHQDRQLVVAEVGVGGLVARRQDPSRGRHLDDVGALSDQLPHPAPHLLGTVDDPARIARVPLLGPEAGTGGQLVVAMPPGLAEHANGDLHARPPNQLALNRLLHT